MKIVRTELLKPEIMKIAVGIWMKFCGHTRVMIIGMPGG
jgi:hypothetical protein